MGANLYITSGVAFYGNPSKKLSEEMLCFDTTDSDLNGASYYKEPPSPGFYKYAEIDFCRETHMYTLHDNFRMHTNGKDESPKILGILCIGFAHNQVAKYILDGRTRDKRLSEFFSKIFGINLHITAHTYDLESDAWNYQLPLRANTSDGKILLNNSYLKIIINSWENTGQIHPIKISAILAMLRELRVCKKIVEKEITNISELALECFHISKLRAQRRDSSYQGFQAWTDEDNDLNQYTYDNLKENLRDYLCDSFNDEGSDHCSMFLTGVFLSEMSENYFSAYESSNGPVSFSENLVESDGLSERTRKFILDNVPSGYLMSLCEQIQNLEEALEKEEEEDDDEES